MTGETVIEVQGLTKRFGSVVAVADLSFSVRRGEIFGLLGPNGAGKTTTIQLLLGLTTPTAGTIWVFGLDLQKHRRAILQRVNLAATYVSLPTNLTVWENLNVFARLYGIRKPRAKIEELLELLDMTPLARRVTGTLSSGQITRLNLCKALLNDPEVLFLDEPTASLDPEVAARVRDILRRIQRTRGITTVFTSHNMREVEALCDRILFLARGRAVAQGTPEEVRARFRTQSLEEAFIVLARDERLYDVAEVGEAD
jgi:ABC-2 type transport system ATP-binding protein